LDVVLEKFHPNLLGSKTIVFVSPKAYQSSFDDD